ncbi:hypothetical protein C8J56DRAFT_62723 [Mycena floridula]|nr:hypothetical protein C8J56DRAFT_62723 [Mycena floridula]
MWMRKLGGRELREAVTATMWFAPIGPASRCGNCAINSTALGRMARPNSDISARAGSDLSSTMTQISLPMPCPAIVLPLLPSDPPTATDRADALRFYREVKMAEEDKAPGVRQEHLWAAATYANNILNTFAGAQGVVGTPMWGIMFHLDLVIVSDTLDALNNTLSNIINISPLLPPPVINYTAVSNTDNRQESALNAVMQNWTPTKQCLYDYY